MKLICLYKVMFQYRVPTYERISQLSNVDFELIHGTSDKNTKLKNYEGEVNFKHTQLPTVWFKAKSNNGVSSQQFLPFLFFRLIKRNPDVLFVEGASSSMITATTAFIYAKLFRKKLIWWSMGALKNRKYKGVRGALEGYFRYLNKHGDAIFTYSTQGENYFINQGIEPQKIFKAINVIDTSAKLKELEQVGKIEKLKGFNIGFVGAINKTKNLELLVDVSKKLQNRYGDVKLHIIGNGDYLDTIKSYVQQTGMEDNVVFYGRMVKGLNAQLAQFTVLVLPGLGGLAIVDGMISSLPIISGLADGTELDLITDDSNGFVTSSITEDYLLKKLCYLHDNPQVVTNMGKMSFERITTTFSFDNYIDIFSQCLKYVSHEK